MFPPLADVAIAPVPPGPPAPIVILYVPASKPIPAAQELQYENSNPPAPPPPVI